MSNTRMTKLEAARDMLPRLLERTGGKETPAVKDLRKHIASLEYQEETGIYTTKGLFMMLDEDLK